MSDCCNDDPNIIARNGDRGAAGTNGWSPLLAIASDGARRVEQIIGWTGGSGNPPAYTNQYIGASGIVEDIADAVDIRGATGTGTTGATGNNGWTAVTANVTDGARIVQQIVDWTGGDGTKPSIVNQFIGAAGIVSSAAAATNIRGATGATGAAGADGTSVAWLPGFMVEYGGSSAPTGWLICDGTAVSRTTYADLFAAIGIVWGAGNGTTTFNLPNSIGRTSIGAGNYVAGVDPLGNTTYTLGQTGGKGLHTLTTPEMPAHTHTVSMHSFTWDHGGGVPITQMDPGGSTASGSTGGGGSHENRQPFIVVNKIIKI